MITIKPIFAWYDIWIGAFIDRPKRRIYIFPIPCFGVVISFGTPPTATPLPANNLEERVTAIEQVVTEIVEHLHARIKAEDRVRKDRMRKMNRERYPR